MLNDPFKESCILMSLPKLFAGALMGSAVLAPAAAIAQPAESVPAAAPVATPVVSRSAPVVTAPAPAATRPAPAAAAPRQAVPPPAPAPLVSTSDDDDTFLLLREAARQDDSAKTNALASRLPHYPLPAYVEYYRLKPRLVQAGAEEIRAFLKRYEGMAIADRLRNDWLLELGRARDWANFDQQLPLFVLNDDLQVKCYALLSRLAKGEKVAEDGRALLLNPPNYGEACAALIASLSQSGQFDSNDLLAQLRLAGEMHATGPSRRIAALLGASDTRAAQAVDYPALAMARGIGSNRAEHEIYLVAVGRMARTSLKLAAIALRKNTPKLSPQEVAIGWAKLAHAASLTLAPEAQEYWQLAAGAPLTQEQVQWKARIALRRSDWKQVRSIIEGMPAPLRAQPVWTYWLARALQSAHGPQHEPALAMYRRIADQNSFYGQLALEELGQLISIPPAGVPLAPEEIAGVASNPGLRRALKFFELRLRPEATREWNWEVRKFSERELLAAAELARQYEILDRMVHTSERTRTEFDYTQRFPSPHSDILTPTVAGLGLDRAWVYGLIRQESRFIMDARSNVGASGLMQVMPGTGKEVARKIGLADYVRNKLSDIRTNITLGANYMNMVLASADGSLPAATAGYNAGPSRQRNWRASLPGPVEGAIFAETIPFMETRIYVKNVMSNATNYAALFENRPQSLKARLGMVGPRAAAGNDLP
jgi:soluble lytic murein transglycosylase